MILAQEQAIFKGQTQFDAMATMVCQAAVEGRPLDEVERELWQRLLGMGRTMLEAYVDGHGSGDLGETLEHEGRTLDRLELLHDRRYVSVFGELTISRAVYGTRETQKHELIPLDARLGLPDGDFSYVLQEWDQSFCVQGSYSQARQTIERILGISQSVRSLEHMNVSMAQDAESFRTSLPTPPAEEEGSILVLTADGKGVPMRRDRDKPAQRGRRKKGEKANKKRSACVGAVYTVEPFIRTAEEIVDEVMRDELKGSRPPPQHKQMRAELNRIIDGLEIRGKDITFSWFAEQVVARNAAGDKPVVCVMDAERALWKTLGRYVLQVVCILDLFHVMERLWDVAHCFHPEGSEEARSFVADRLKRILEGDVGRVIGGMKQMGTKRGLRGSRKKQLSTAIGYLQRNRRFMRYDEYLAKGYPIGSGVAEGACRHLVKDRMEQTGMRWRVTGAQAMLDLRAIYLNDDWEAFQKYRIQAERRKLYPYREMVESLCNAAA